MFQPMPMTKATRVVVDAAQARRVERAVSGRAFRRH